MKNLIALAIGLALISAAIITAAGTTSQDIAVRPQVARALATDLHTTPSATPTAPPTPTASPTPIRLTEPEPQPELVLAKLFQYPYEGTVLNTTAARVNSQQLDFEHGAPRLILTGDRLTTGRGMQVASGAFAAVMSWQNGEYVTRFLHVVLGHGFMQVWPSSSPDGTLVFRFSSLGEQSDASGLHTFFVRPCKSPGYPATPGAHSDDDECY